MQIARRVFAVFIMTLSAATMAQPGKPVDIVRVKKPVPNEYIVVLKDDVRHIVDEVAEGLAHSRNGRILSVYDKAIVGFSVVLPDGAAEALVHHPLVEWVEESSVVELSAKATVDTEFWNNGIYYDNWHLDHIDPSRSNGYYEYCTTYENQVTVYTFDTPVRRDHVEFTDYSGGVSYKMSTNGVDVAPADCGYVWVDGLGWQWKCYGATNADANCTLGYHGTAVASLIGGVYVGVAKNAFIWPVAVFNCSGQPGTSDTSTVIDGIEWVLDERTGNNPAVANFSIFFNYSPIGATQWNAMHDAIESLVDDGIVVVVSANNQDGNNCATQTPATLGDEIDGVITVGGVYSNNYRVTDESSQNDPGSNFGPCLDVFAPGYEITTAGRNAEDHYAVIENSAATSFSAAIVSGLAARYLEQNPSASPATVENYIKSTAVSEVMDAGTGTTTKLVVADPECN